MSDPAETPAQAIERLRKEIANLKRLRAEVPRIILEPYVETATDHIKEVATRMMVTPTLPASQAIESSRQEQAAETAPTAPPSAPPTLPAPGTKVTVTATKVAGIVLTHVPGGWISPERKWTVLVLTEAGQLLELAPEEITPTEGIAVVGPAPTAPKFKSGDHVKDKTTGKTGYITEIADDKVLIALDEGGVITRSLAELEPI